MLSPHHSPLNLEPVQAPLVPVEFVEFIRRIDALPKDRAGALVFGEREAARGVVYVELGRVCLAMDTTAPGRLREMLHPERLRTRSAAMATLMRSVKSASDVVQMYRLGHLALRPVLLEHCCDAIRGLLLEDHGPPSWFERANRYSARLSFDTAEVLAGLCRAQDGTEIHEGLLRRQFEGKASAVAVYRPDVGPASLRDARDDLQLGVDVLLQLAAWGEQALRSAASVCNAAEVVLQTEGSSTRVAWSHRGTSFAAISPEPQVSMQIVAAHIRTSAPGA